MKRILLAVSLILTAALLSAPLAVYAAEAPADPDLVSKYAAVYVPHEDAVIYSKGAYEKIQPSATAKIMTGIIAVLHYSDPDTPVTASKAAIEAIKQGSLVLDIKEGETHSAQDLIYAVITGGYADAALILAVDIAGSVRDFTALMNEKAAELGAYDTVYANPTGDDAGTAVTTARDIAKIAAYALELPLFMKAANAPSYMIPATDKSERYTVYPRNMLRVPSSTGYYLDYVSGVCAGVTAKAGYCLVTSAEVSGYTCIFVISGGKSVDGAISTYSDVKKIIKYSSSLGYSYKTVVDTYFVCAELPVSLASGQNHVILVPENEIRLFLPAFVDPKKDMTYSVTLSTDSLEAPVEKGTVCGSITFFYEGEAVASENVVTKEFIPKSSFEVMKSELSDFLGSVYFAVLVAVIAAVILLLIVRYIIIKRKRRE